MKKVKNIFEDIIVLPMHGDEKLCCNEPNSKVEICIYIKLLFQRKSSELDVENLFVSQQSYN